MRSAFRVLWAINESQHGRMLAGHRWVLPTKTRLLTQIHIRGPESRAALEAHGALRYERSIAFGPQEILDLKQDLEQNEYNFTGCC